MGVSEPRASERQDVPWFAALYDPVMGPIERRLFGPLRTRLLGEVQGDVLDLGAGTGANFPIYSRIAHAGGNLDVTAAEPDHHMALKARDRAAALGLNVRFASSPAEVLEFEDDSFDVVVATLVLCTVTDPVRSLAEIRRVLRPGGELVYLEHVRSQGLPGYLQDVLCPAWSVIGAGCRLNRPTGELIAQAGFTSLEQEVLAAPFPIFRLVVGRATA